MILNFIVLKKNKAIAFDFEDKMRWFFALKKVDCVGVEGGIEFAIDGLLFEIYE